jgi:hypothetical protein
MRTIVGLILPVIEGMTSFMIVFFLYNILFAVSNEKLEENLGD